MIRDVILTFLTFCAGWIFGARWQRWAQQHQCEVCDHYIVEPGICDGCADMLREALAEPTVRVLGAGGFVQSPNCIGGCTSLYGSLCGPCYRLNRHKVAWQ